jgi:hypothetical protein
VTQKENSRTGFWAAPHRAVTHSAVDVSVPQLTHVFLNVLADKKTKMQWKNTVSEVGLNVPSEGFMALANAKEIKSCSLL